MDINTLRNLMTLVAFATFLGIVWWAYGPSRRERFEQDARIALDDGDDEVRHGDAK